jgi:hypothetical protein
MSFHKSTPLTAAPPTQQRSRPRSPPLVIGWLGLLPKSMLPIKSHEDFAIKISTLLLGHQPVVEDVNAIGHSLPSSRQQSETPK